MGRIKLSKLSDTSNQIWITSRIRMISEKKAIHKQNFSYLIVTYYSLFSILIAIFSDYYKEYYAQLDRFALSASVVILVASLVSSGFRFESAAREYRECYLQLQRLYSDTTLSEDQKNNQYRASLDRYPNHSIYDYHDFIVNHTYWENKPLFSGDSEIKLTNPIFFSYILRKFFYFAVAATLIAAPGIFLAIPFLSRCPR